MVRRAVGQHITIIIPADRREEEDAIIVSIREGKRIEYYDTFRRHKDGSLLDISLTVSPVCDSNGAIVGASKIARDISERKQAIQRQMLLLPEALLAMMLSWLEAIRRPRGPIPRGNVSTGTIRLHHP